MTDSELTIRYGSFLSSPDSSNASWLWKGIVQCKSLLLSGTCLQVSINSHFPVWTSAWIPTLPNFKPAPKHPSNKEFPSLLISDLFIPGTSKWNITTILSLFNEFSAQEILKLHISSVVSLKYLWTLALSGKFSIGSACLSILAKKHPKLIIPSSQPFWKNSGN
jgi:hypothetical protein